jgi:Icc-related predicted phosphoesterase
MKILAFTDIHGNEKALEQIEATIKKEMPDILIDCGDISIFETNLNSLLYRIASFGLPVLIMHGNHENQHEFKALCKQYKNLIFMHDNTYRDSNHLFFGYGGGGFSSKDRSFERSARKHMKELKENDKLILITHGPPYGTKLDNLFGEHVGNRSFRDFIKIHKPVLALSGHLHENNGKKDNMNRTKLINPGPYGKIIEI